MTKTNLIVKKASLVLFTYASFSVTTAVAGSVAGFGGSTEVMQILNNVDGASHTSQAGKVQLAAPVTPAMPGGSSTVSAHVTPADVLAIGAPQTERATPSASMAPAPAVPARPTAPAAPISSTPGQDAMAEPSINAPDNGTQVYYPPAPSDEQEG